MRRFYWIGSAEIPAQSDLRAGGWSLIPDQPIKPDGTIAFIPDRPVLVDRTQIDPRCWRALGTWRSTGFRRWVIALGVAAPEERARLLNKGFGDVPHGEIALSELAARALRVIEYGTSLRRHRRHGPLLLDLIDREGFVGAQALGLHPREFALLWRLMETPGKPVDKRELLRDVWHLSYVPETNSVAVHASRLRTKLAVAGLEGWIQTTASGGYQLGKGNLSKALLDKTP